MTPSIRCGGITTKARPKRMRPPSGIFIRLQSIRKMSSVFPQRQLHKLMGNGRGRPALDPTLSSPEFVTRSRSGPSLVVAANFLDASRDAGEYGDLGFDSRLYLLENELQPLNAPRFAAGSPPLSAIPDALHSQS